MAKPSTISGVQFRVFGAQKLNLQHNWTECCRGRNKWFLLIEKVF